MNTAFLADRDVPRPPSLRADRLDRPARPPQRLRRIGVVRVWFRRLRERRDLAQMPLRELRDIGLSPSEARAEAAKPFWRP